MTADETSKHQVGATTRGDGVGWWVIGIALLTAIVHLATASRYDIFRNELYFIVCGWHPAFGYVDLPPLVPLLSAFFYALGHKVWVLRLPAVAAAVGLVPLSAALTRVFGGSRSAIVLSALAAATAPALIGLTTILTTETFEPLCWTACAYLVAEAVVRERRSALIWAGIVAGVAMEAKYGMAIWFAALALGVVATPARRILAWRQTWYGVLLAGAIAAPSLAWQALHGWPFFEVITNHSASIRAFTGGPLHFEIGQALALNVLLAPLWIAGVVGPFVTARLKDARFASIAFVAATVIVIATGGKDYYLFPAYATAFAVGAAALQGLNRWVTRIWMALSLANAVLIAPIVLPILPPAALARFMARNHAKPAPDEREAVGAPLSQLFSDEFGWRELEGKVAAVYAALPPHDRRHLVVFASNYGEAAALDVYGGKDGLPRATSGEDQYYLWGPGPDAADIVLVVNGWPDRWRGICGSVETVATFGAPFAMPYENQRPIFLCRDPKGGLKVHWSGFKRYG